jgi:hypothetical protein
MTLTSVEKPATIRPLLFYRRRNTMPRIHTGLVTSALVLALLLLAPANATAGVELALGRAKKWGQEKKFPKTAIRRSTIAGLW